MKNNFAQIIGKRIKAVVVKERPNKAPAQQVFIVFDDDTHYEIYSCKPTMKGCGRVDEGGVKEICSRDDGAGVKTELYCGNGGVLNSPPDFETITP